MDNVKYIRFYAQCKTTGNLYSFRWAFDNSFTIKVDSNVYQEKPANDYKIVGVGFYQ